MEVSSGFGAFLVLLILLGTEHLADIGSRGSSEQKWDIT